MKKTLAQKKEDLEKLRKEVEEQECIEQYENEKSNAISNGLYVPKATAIAKYSIYNRGERDFEEIGDSCWYTAGQLLGTPDIKKGTNLVLLDIGDYLAWYSMQPDGDYFGINDDELGLEDTDENRDYFLTEIKEINK